MSELVNCPALSRQLWDLWTGVHCSSGGISSLAPSRAIHYRDSTLHSVLSVPLQKTVASSEWRILGKASRLNLKNFEKVTFHSHPSQRPSHQHCRLTVEGGGTTGPGLSGCLLSYRLELQGAGWRYPTHRSPLVRSPGPTPPPPTQHLLYWAGVGKKSQRSSSLKESLLCLEHFYA